MQWSLLVAWKEMVVAGTHEVPGTLMSTEWLRKTASRVDGASINTCNYNGSLIRVRE